MKNGAAVKRRGSFDSACNGSPTLEIRHDLRQGEASAGWPEHRPAYLLPSLPTPTDNAVMTLPCFQFRLRTLLLVVTAIAVATRAYFSGSKLWFLIMLAGACGGIGVCTYLALTRRKHRWAFATSAVVGLIGLAVTFSQEMPFTGSNVIKVMWTLSPFLELTYSAYIGIVYLIATVVIAALSGLIVASVRFFVTPASGH